MKPQTIKVWIIAVLLSGLCLNANAQEIRQHIAMSSVPVHKVLSEIEKNSDYLFMFNDSKIDTDRIVSINTATMQLNDVLNQLFAGTNVVWKIENTYKGLELTQWSRNRQSR